MSFLKNWKLLLAALAVAMFTACAGSSGSSSGDYEGDSASGATSAKASSKPKEEISEAKLKSAETEATAATDENHKLRKEIFEAKTKLGMSADDPVPEE